MLNKLFILFFFLGSLTFPVYGVLVLLHFGPQDFDSKIEWGGLCLFVTCLFSLVLDIEVEEGDDEYE